MKKFLIKIKDGKKCLYGEIKMEKPVKGTYNLTNPKEKVAYYDILELEAIYKEHLASLPFVAFAEALPNKEGDIVGEGKDFEFRMDYTTKEYYAANIAVLEICEKCGYNIYACECKKQYLGGDHLSGNGVWLDCDNETYLRQKPHMRRILKNAKAIPISNEKEETTIEGIKKVTEDALKTPGGAKKFLQDAGIIEKEETKDESQSGEAAAKEVGQGLKTIKERVDYLEKQISYFRSVNDNDKIFLYSAVVNELEYWAMVYENSHFKYDLKKKP